VLLLQRTLQQVLSNELVRLTLNLIHWGLLSPIVIAHKTLIQKLWQDNLLWDEQL